MVGMSAARTAPRTCGASACCGEAPSARSCSITAASAWAEAKIRSKTWATTFIALASIIPPTGTR